MNSHCLLCVCQNTKSLSVCVCLISFLSAFRWSLMRRNSARKSAMLSRTFTASGTSTLHFLPLSFHSFFLPSSSPSIFTLKLTVSLSSAAKLRPENMLKHLSLCINCVVKRCLIFLPSLCGLICLHGWFVWMEKSFSF